jgi:hypothetical protein
VFLLGVFVFFSLKISVQFLSVSLYLFIILIVTKQSDVEMTWKKVEFCVKKIMFFKGKKGLYPGRVHRTVAMCER